jgi:hypothetical protein
MKTMDWRCGSSRKSPALQSQSPEFKPQSHQKKKRKERKKNMKTSWVWWVTPVILATWEAEIGRIMVRGQQGNGIVGRVHKPLISTNKKS